MNTAQEVFQSKTKIRNEKENALGLLISYLIDNPKMSEQKHKREFLNFVLQEENDSFVEAIIVEWLAIKYSTALRAAKPPSTKDILEIAAKRKEVKRKEDTEVQKAKAEILSKIFDLVTPNGKKLKDCTGAECIKLGSFYSKIGNKIKPRQIVGKVLTQEDIQGILEKAVG